MEFEVRTRHPQASVTVGETSAEVDRDLVPLITQLWRLGLSTSRSCQRHSSSKKVWIEFPNPFDADASTTPPHVEERLIHR